MLITLITTITTEVLLMSDNILDISNYKNTSFPKSTYDNLSKPFPSFIDQFIGSTCIIKSGYKIRYINVIDEDAIENHVCNLCNSKNIHDMFDVYDDVKRIVYTCYQHLQALQARDDAYNKLHHTEQRRGVCPVADHRFKRYLDDDLSVICGKIVKKIMPKIKNKKNEMVIKC